MSPTNPIVPPAHTAVALASEPDMRQRKRTFWSGSPSDCAVFSPEDKISSGFTVKNINTKERKAGNKSIITKGHPFPLKLPCVHI